MFVRNFAKQVLYAECSNRPVMRQKHLKMCNVLKADISNELETISNTMFLKKIACTFKINILQ